MAELKACMLGTPIHCLNSWRLIHVVNLVLWAKPNVLMIKKRTHFLPRKCAQTLTTMSRGPFHRHGLTLMASWICNHIPSNMCFFTIVWRQIQSQTVPLVSLLLTLGNLLSIDCRVQPHRKTLITYFCPIVMKKIIIKIMRHICIKKHNLFSFHAHMKGN